MGDSGQPSVAPAGATVSEDLGRILRDARVAQDLTIEQLATELRIEGRQLSALEENRFEQIGVPVFVKGYLRQYGQRLGVDYRDLLALYYKQTKLEEVQIQPSRTIKLRDERQIAVWIVATLVLLVVVVGLVVWWANGGSIDISTLTGSAFRVAGSSPAPVVAAGTSVATAAAAAPMLAPAPRLVPASDRVEAPAAIEASVRPTSELAAPESAVQDETESAAPGTIPLDLTFDAESWVEITDARGERLFYGLGAAGRHLAVHGESPVAIVLGNADAVRLLVNGESYPIPTQNRQGNLARFSVDVDEE